MVAKFMRWMERAAAVAMNDTKGEGETGPTSSNGFDLRVIQGMETGAAAM